MEEKKVYSGLEIRTFSGDYVPTVSDDSRVIEGYALVFDTESLRMYDCWEDVYFIEKINRSAVTEEFIRSCDIKALMEHNRERLLARSNKGTGTLQLFVDEKGLKYRFEAPKTLNGDEALELVRRGDIVGSSFAFIAYGEDCVHRSWDESRQVWVHEIRKFNGIYDVSLTSDPVYIKTSVEVRSLLPPDKPKNESGEERKGHSAPLSHFEMRMKQLNIFL